MIWRSVRIGWPNVDVHCSERGPSVSIQESRIPQDHEIVHYHQFGTQGDYDLLPRLPNPFSSVFSCGMPVGDLDLPQILLPLRPL